MILTNCNDCIHKPVCKHKEWANSFPEEKKINFPEFAQREFQAEIAIKCMNFHQETPKTQLNAARSLPALSAKRHNANIPIKEEYMTMDEASKILGLKHSDVRKLIICGKLKAEKNNLVNNRWEIPIKEIARYQMSVA